MGRHMGRRTAGLLCAAAIAAPLGMFVGTGAASAGSGFSAAPNPVQFGSVPLGTTASQTVTVTPDAGFQLGGVGGSGLNTPFNFTNDTCGTTVGPQTCTFVETFTPTTTGLATGQLFVNEFENTPSGVVNRNLEVDLSGTGVSVFAASPNPVQFGSVPVGTTVSRTVTVKPDTGFQVGPVGGSGLNTPFSFSNDTCGTTVGPQTCSFVETFTPTTTGPAAGQLFFDEFENTPNGIVNVNPEVDISGDGVVPTTLTATPAVLQLSGLHLWLFTLNARLTSGGVGVGGQTVVFTSGSSYLCTAVTAGNGAASCSGVAGVLSIVLSLGYTATFSGTTTLAPSSVHAGLIG